MASALPTSPLARRLARVGLWLLAAAPALAQTTTVDSARATPPGGVFADTAALRRSGARPAASDDAPDAQRTLARSAVLTAAERLDGAAFRFETGVPGGPVAVSWLGLAPQQSTMHVGPFLLNDGHTGAARFDLVPPAWLDSLAPDGLAPAAFNAPLRDFDAPQPLTEARYQTAQGGLQRVEAVHAQTRDRRLLGVPGRLALAFGYAASAWTGRYANGGVHGHRALLARAAFAAPRTTTTVTLLHTRNRPDAPGGYKLGTGTTIYDPLRAAARLTTAERGTERTDVALEAERGAWSAGLYAGTDRMRYTPAAADTLTFRYRYAQGELGWTAQVGGFEVEAAAQALAEHLPDATRDTLSVADAITVFSYGTTATVARGPVSASGEALVYDGLFYPKAALRIGPLAAGPAALSAEIGLSSTPNPFLYDRGFGPFVDLTALSFGAAPTDLRFVRLHGTVSAGTFSARLTGFYHAENLTELVAQTDADTAYATETGADRVGAAASLGFREDASSGFYATTSGTALHTLLSSGIDADAFAESVPGLSGQMQIGVRLNLFRRDLLADVFVRGRGWTAFGGRVLHAPTGVYALRGGGPSVPAALLVDVGATARVRAATLWLVLDNALANTPLLDGVALVPGYPFDARRLRFGVFWPISG